MTFGSARVNGATIPYIAPPPPPPPNTDIDNFGNRTIALDNVTSSGDEARWAQASGGLTWRCDGNVNSLFGVSGGLGQMQVGSFPSVVSGFWSASLIDWDVGKFWYPVEIAAVGSLFVRFRFNTVGTSGGADTLYTELTLSHDGSPDSWDVHIMATQRATVGNAFRGRIEFLGGTLLGKADWIENEWYTLEVRQSGTTAEARVWADSESIPAFMVSYVASAFPWSHNTDDADSLKWEVNAENAGFANTIDTDRIWFVPA